jgi:hypothetical protein
MVWRQIGLRLTVDTNDAHRVTQDRMKGLVVQDQEELRSLFLRMLGGHLGET